MSEPYAKKGERIVTENTKTPVFEVTRDVYPGDSIQSSDFKSVCDFADPVTGEEIRTHYKDERFAKSDNGHLRFHFEDGWR